MTRYRTHKQTSVRTKRSGRPVGFRHFFVTGLILAGILVLRAGSQANLTSLAAGFGNVQILLQSSVGRQTDFVGKGVTYKSTSGGANGSFLLTNGGAEVNLAEGVYEFFLPTVPGYITPAPPGPNGQVPQTGRQVVVENGKTTVVGNNGGPSITYHRIADLKPVARSSTEVLEFTPSNRVAQPQWGYLKGVASVAVAGSNLWQYSEANILYTQAIPPDVFPVTKTNNATVLAPGVDTTYLISVGAGGGISPTYTAQVTDTLQVSNPQAPGQLGAISVVSTRLLEQVCAGPGQTNCTLNPRQDLTPQESRAGDTMTLAMTIPNLVRLNQYFVEVTLRLDPTIAAGTILANNACVTAGGVQECTDTTGGGDVDVVLAAFIRETVGGTIFARGGLTLTNPNDDKSNVLYTIGSGGQLDAVSRSEGWEVSGYNLRSDAMLGIDDPGDCSSLMLQDKQKSGYCLMQRNIDRMIESVSGISNSRFQLTPNAGISGGRLNPNGIAEGQVWHAQNGWTIGTTEFSGRGTIIVDGDLNITGNITYKNPVTDIVGFIVRNGNVNIADSVTQINGVFYIYSDGTNGGSFITGTAGLSPDQSQQLVVRGLVVASGQKVGASRQNAFVLNRTYIGDLAAIESGAIAPNLNNIPPAEEFQYDARIIVNPPPGFSRDVLRGRQ